MRIQHNIAALNSYRQLSGNNKALSKNLEKLSSGYKINRAGDDAAGLAISEKMRAQIKGLEAATKNANDGISLVQTAEGALTEVHDMLNRMTYLATQSANGTYDNEVDRANLQKEVESLVSEIDRISESTNFNGLNLLNGELGLNTDAFTKITSTDAVSATSKNGELNIGDVRASSADAEPAGKASFTVSLKNLKVSEDGKLKITIGDKEIETAELKKDDGVDEIADALKTAFDAGDKEIDGVEYETKVTAEGVTFTQKNDPTKADTEVIYPDFEVTIEGTDGNGATAATAESHEIDLADFNLAGTAGNGDTFTLQIDGETLTSDAAAGTETTAADIAALFDGKIITRGGETYTVSVNDTKITLTAGNAGEIDAADQLAANSQVTFGQSGTNLTIGTATTAATTTAGAAAVDGTPSGVEGDYIKHVVSTTASVIPKDAQLAKATFELDFDNLKDGSKLTIGNETYTFKIGDESTTTAATGETLIDLSKIEEEDIADNKAKITTALVDALDGGNDVWEVGNFEAANGKIELLEQATNQAAVAANTDGAVDLTSVDKVKESIKMVTAQGDKVSEASVVVDGSKMVAGDKVAVNGKTYEFVAKAGDEAEGNIAVVVEGLSNKVGTATGDAAQALKDALTGAGVNATLKDGVLTVKAANMNEKASIGSAGVKLQVGDTADEFNKVNVKVDSMDSKSLGINGIDISTQEGAAAAIEKIKAAINTVSSTRGDLGAIQNRLDHTINNLGVTKENITDAESRIRDTDMAEEMMVYTKNNILVQAAQSMLAQANQVPQGVLQLLQ